MASKTKGKRVNRTAEQKAETVGNVRDYMKEHGVGVQKACDALSVDAGNFYRWTKAARGAKAAATQAKAAKPKAAARKAVAPHPRAAELQTLLTLQAEGVRAVPAKRRVMAFVVFGEPGEVAETVAAIAAKGGLQ